MNILFYDCFSGISGDMNLAAMLALGVDPEHLRSQLSLLGLDHEFELRITADARKGIHGTRVDVEVYADGHTHHDHQHARHAQHAHNEPHGHHHGHAEHAEHAQHAEHHAKHGHHAPHRTLPDVEAIIGDSALSEPVKETALAIFRRLARAEATVHGTTMDKVHFHEVGATDALVDIVGAAICRHALDVDEIWASPVELGGGFVRCAHGTIPVPAPATVELLQGVPTTRGAVQAETTTPTGAAILAELVTRFTPAPAMTARATAYGIGHRDTDIPNVLRVHLAETAQPADTTNTQDARLLQCNIDDMTAEALGVAMDVLMEAGAMDVHFTPVIMKKNRPATCVSLLCGADEEARFRDLLFTHTTTLGIKSLPLCKHVLDVEFQRLNTPLGPVTMKLAMRDGAIVRSKPELEDCRALAKANGISLAEVYAIIGTCRP